MNPAVVGVKQSKTSTRALLTSTIILKAVQAKFSNIVVGEQREKRTKPWMSYTLSQLPHSLSSFRYVNDPSFLLTSSPFIQRGNAGQANQPFCRDGRHTLRQQPRRSVPTTLKFFPFLAAEELRCEVKTGRGGRQPSRVLVRAAFVCLHFNKDSEGYRRLCLAMASCFVFRLGWCAIRMRANEYYVLCTLATVTSGLNSSLLLYIRDQDGWIESKGSRRS